MHKKFRQSSTVFKKSGILLEKFKTLRAPSTIDEIWHTFPDYQSLQKGVWDFLILFRS